LFVIRFAGPFRPLFRTKLPGFCSFARFDPFFFTIVSALAPAEEESTAAEEQDHNDDEE
jgi:hypothetical protein